MSLRSQSGHSAASKPGSCNRWPSARAAAFRARGRPHTSAACGSLRRPSVVTSKLVSSCPSASMSASAVASGTSTTSSAAPTEPAAIYSSNAAKPISPLPSYSAKKSTPYQAPASPPPQPAHETTPWLPEPGGARTPGCPNPGSEHSSHFTDNFRGRTNFGPTAAECAVRVAIVCPEKPCLRRNGANGQAVFPDKL